jgi:hypothetical protein
MCVHSSGTIGIKAIAFGGDKGMKKSPEVRNSVKSA